MVFSLENGAEQSVCFRGSSCADSNLEMVEMRASLAAFSTSPRLQHHGKSPSEMFSMKTLNVSTAVESMFLVLLLIDLYQV